MTRMRTIIATAFALLPIALVVPSTAHAETRVALVVGNAAYQAGALNTPANDAGLIAQTLQAAGFDVVGARDLDQDSLRRAFRDFLDKATSSGPDTVAFVYLSGYGVQLEGENYFVPIDARIARDADVTAEALRISDYTRPLAALKLKAGIVVLDLARANPFAKSGPPLAGGLALAEPEPGLLLALNAAPGTVAPEGPGPYGPYAQALAEMMREGGLPLAGIFDRARLRVNDLTKGAEVPWHASKVEASLVFFERAADAPAPAVSTEQTAAIRARPIRELAAQEAYIAALERDTLEGYGEFLAAYADDPMAGRVRAIIAARREALTWRRTRVVDTPPAYWSYLRRYPQGPHAADAHRRLAFLAAALEPPPSFAALAYDLPPPPPEEIVFIQRPVLMFDDPDFAFAAPPPPPVVFLAPPPPEFVLLPAPPPPVGTLPAADADIPASAGMGPSAGLCGAAPAEQRDLQQRPQHGRHQQCDEHRDHYQSERPDADLGAAGASRGAAARRANRRACPRGARAGAAAFGRAEGRHAAESDSARIGHIEWRLRTRGEATAGTAAKAAAAGNAGAALAAGDRHSGRAGCAHGGAPAGHAIGVPARNGCETGNAARASTGCDPATINTTCGGNNTGRARTAARRPRQAGNAAIAGAGGEAGAALVICHRAWNACCAPDRHGPGCAFTHGSTGARREAVGTAAATRRKADEPATAARREAGRAATGRAPAPHQAGNSTCGCHKPRHTVAAAPGAWPRIAATAAGCKAGAASTTGTGAAPQCKAGSAATAARCKAGAAATAGTSTQRKTGDASTASCAGGRSRPAGAASTGAQGMSAGQDHVGRQRPTCCK